VKLVIPFALLLASLALPAAAQTQNARVQQSVIVRLLEAKRGFPTRIQLYRTGPKKTSNSILVDVANNRHTGDRLRLNAVRALEYFPTKQTKSVLMTLLYAKRQKPAYQAACMRALARAFGVNMYFELLPWMKDLKPRVRSGAAIALAEIDDERVKGILMTHLTNERDITVRQALERALKMAKDRQERKHHKRLEDIRKRRK